MLYFVVGVIVGFALCVAFPSLPSAINKGIAEAKANKQARPKQHPIIPDRF